MKHSERISSAGALAAALISLSCCLPFSIPAAFGLAGIAVFANAYQGWLTAASVLLLVMGVIQIVRKPACQRRSPVSITLLVIAAALVVAVTVFPQSIATFLADTLP